MTSRVCYIYLSTKINQYSFESTAKEKVFAKAIYLKVAGQVNVKTQTELEIWANCSGNKNFRCIFSAVQLSIFWISLKLRV